MRIAYRVRASSFLTRSAVFLQAISAQLQATGDASGSDELRSHIWMAGPCAERAAQTLGYVARAVLKHVRGATHHAAVRLPGQCCRRCARHSRSYSQTW